MLDKILARVKELEEALNKSQANHNVIFGQLAEAKHIAELAQLGATDIEKVVDAVVAMESPTEQGTAQ